MKSVISNIGDISFKYDSTITIELGEKPVLVPDYIVDVLSERLGDNISIVGGSETEVAPEVTEEETFASETEELKEETEETTTEVAPEVTEEVEKTVEAPVPKKKGKGAKNK